MIYRGNFSIIYPWTIFGKNPNWIIFPNELLQAARIAESIVFIEFEERGLKQDL